MYVLITFKPSKLFPTILMRVTLYPENGLLKRTPTIKIIKKLLIANSVQ